MGQKTAYWGGGWGERGACDNFWEKNRMKIKEKALK